MELFLFFFSFSYLFHPNFGLIYLNRILCLLASLRQSGDHNNKKEKHWEEEGKNYEAQFARKLATHPDTMPIYDITVYIYIYYDMT